MEMCGKLQPQDSSKELFAADARIEGELADQVSRHQDADMPMAAQATATGASVEPSLGEPDDGSNSNSQDRLIAADEAEMRLTSDVALVADSSDLDESYDPVQEFDELLDTRGLRAPLTKQDLLWRKAMYCRYRCHLINLD